MNNISLYSFEDKLHSAYNICSRESKDAPLIVNCAGRFSSDQPFTTDNPSGRLDYYLFHLTEGELTVYFPNKTVIAVSGDTVVFPSNTPYKYTHSKNSQISYLWVHFTGSAAEFYLDSLGFKNLPSVFRSHSKNHASANFQALFDVFSRDDNVRVHSLAAILLQILTAIARSFNEENGNSAILRSVKFINSNYTEKLSVPDLAGSANLSVSRYCALFKQTTGISPINYITNLRIGHACELLRTTNMPINSIGNLVGYSDPYFFSRIFKKKLNQSPAKYRKG